MAICCKWQYLCLCISKKIFFFFEYHVVWWCTAHENQLTWLLCWLRHGLCALGWVRHLVGHWLGHTVLLAWAWILTRRVVWDLYLRRNNKPKFSNLYLMNFEGKNNWITLVSTIFSVEVINYHIILLLQTIKFSNHILLKSRKQINSNKDFHKYLVLKFH